MRKGGFNMYLTKEKSSMSLYKNYEPRFSKHKDTEIQVYLAHAIGHDVSKQMKSSIRTMSVMIARGFAKGGD